MITVIIPAYNAQDTLEACLEALQNQSLDRTQYKVIVVDDGSTDQTAQIARRYPVQLLSQSNAGPASARNLGAQFADGDLLLFTDADCEPALDWIERMRESFSEPGVVGVKGAYQTRQREWVARFVQLEYEQKYARMARQLVQRGGIDFIDTYSAAYRKDVFDANAGFDPTFTTASVEDQEFSFRLARKGYRLSFNPQAIVYHQHDASFCEYWQRKFKIGFWKALLLRWHPDRVVNDSHTPQILKVQMLLVALWGAALVCAILWPPGWWMALGVLFSFMCACLPFQVWAARRDLSVAFSAPILLMLRAAALSAGLVAGAARFISQRDQDRAALDGPSWAIKRAVDIVCSLIGLVLAAPLLALLSILIRLDSPGPAFFVQQRVGKDGRPFQMIKLRTMVDGAEEMLSALIGEAALDAPVLKVPNDPRVTRIGRFLRRSSLDELPQLWNVLRGEMSLVGPRPEEERIVRRYTDWHRRRLSVKPGMTGPMQVNGRAELSLDERTRLEIDYIEHYSLWRDLCILARTVSVIVSGWGAY